MKKTFTCVALTTMFAAMGFAQKTFDISVTNNSKAGRSNAPVVLQLSQYGNSIKSALVTMDGKEIPCQLDDIDGNGTFDELCFLADMPGKATMKFGIQLSDTGKPRQYEPQVYVEMMLANKKIKEANKQNLYISQLTVENGVNAYWMIHHHGAAFESDLVAYRIYFDHRQTVDIYGKYRKGLELKETQFYPDSKQKEQGYGDDVLWVGQTFGVGALRGWDGKQPTMLTDVEHRSQRIVARGPLRTIVEVKDQGWTPQPGQEPIDMTTYYTLYAGHRDCSVDVKFNRNAEAYRFATGIINVKNSTEHSDKKGLRGCWGTDWPVSAKDSVGHKRETVGLGICIPTENIVSEETANKDNYGFVVKPTADRLHYDIVFCSDNESFGMHSDKDWYKFLDGWKKELQQPLVVEEKH
ncbi:MAG: DUF4861 domain-containing protein [Prevotella sp.]|nr:DUF4861 domain-containing protein [Prevotella sp.]